jgi:hypothetical protein
MTEYKLEAESARFDLKGNPVDLSTIRGEVTINFFFVVYNIFFTLLIAIIGVIPIHLLCWQLKILLFIIVLIGLFFCFRIVYFRKFLTKIRSTIFSFKERL